jgi:transposase
MEEIGLATSGMLGARLGGRLGMPASWMTILRRVMARPFVSVKPVVELGIDDFSFRRGRTFGTILVDLQSHHVIDLLPDRSVKTVSVWLRAHPEISLVSRDRGGDYAAAVRKVASEATQIADRFHLLQNLGEALEGMLARHLAAHRNRQAEQFTATPLQEVQTWQPTKLSPKEAQQKQSRREERLARYQQAVTLRQLGFSQRVIADRIGIGHATVSRWLESGTFPEQQPRPRKTALEPSLPFLYERWEAGCHNIRSVVSGTGGSWLYPIVSVDL